MQKYKIPLEVIIKDFNIKKEDFLEYIKREKDTKQ